MKTTFFTVPLLAALATAAPQLGGGGSQTSNDVQNGQCGDMTLIFARGSTEQGNMVSPFYSVCLPELNEHQGTVVGAPLCAAMKKQANVACQGVGGAYKAQLAPNTLPQGTDQASIDQAVQVRAISAPRLTHST